MSLVFCKWFDRSLDRLTGPERRDVSAAVMDLRMRPDLPGLRLHKLSNGLHSISASLDLRVILHIEGSTVLCLHAGHHDAAYRWAERHRVERHVVTGELQLVELPLIRADKPAARREPSAAGTPPFFAGEEPATLLALGVPPDWIGPVRAIASDDDLLDLSDHLPEDVVERLLDLRYGRRPEPPLPVPAGSGVLEAAAGGSQFRVITDDSALRDALERPWPEWAIWLHPDQRAAVEATHRGPARVTGPAGTGKTVVALHRAARLARARPDARVLLSSFSKALAARMSEGLDVLLRAEPEVRDRVRAQHLHGLAAEIVRASPSHPRALGDRELDRLVVEARGDVPKSPWSDAFLVAEWRSVIDFLGVRSLDSYLAARRTGRGRRLSAAERATIWPVFARMREGMERRREASWPDFCDMAAALLSERGETPFDHVILDEAQDLGPRELAFAMQLCPPGPDALFLTGDAGQRIYRYPWSWRDIGLDVRGRSRRLSVNYRTSAEIRACAESLLAPASEALGGDEEPRAALSRFRGPPPQIRSCQTREDERGVVAAFLKDLLSAGFAPGEIAVLARTAPRLADALDGPARALGLARQGLSETARDRLVAGTLHGAKGLEYRAVAIVGAEDGTLPLAAALDADPDAAGRAALNAQERHLLYVGMTRARERLLVTHVGPPSPFLPRIGEGA